jgi:hypothetical protein
MTVTPHRAKSLTLRIATEALMAVARSKTFAARAALLGGYDLRDPGGLVWNG